MFEMAVSLYNLGICAVQVISNNYIVLLKYSFIPFSVKVLNQHI